MNIVTGIKLKDRYEIIKQLGSGAFGHTYLAKDHDLHSSYCVVKHLTVQTDPKTLAIAQRLFKQEAIVLHDLKHSQIPKLFAYFNIDNEFFLVQEFIEGDDLTKEIIPQKKWSQQDIITLLKDILEVLVFVHEKNIIHRDLKPANLMRRNSDSRIILIDFGAVKQITQTSIIVQSVTIGTPGFMPDEQASGKPVLASDIYSLGMIAIQALTGLDDRGLPKQPNIRELKSKFNLNLTNNFTAFLEKMVAEYYQNRYQNATEALEALENLSKIPHNSAQTLISTPTIISPPPQRSFGKIWGLVFLVISVGLMIVVTQQIWSYFSISKSTNNHQPENNPSGETVTPIPSKYPQLEQQLQDGNWQQADLETRAIMLTLVNRQKEGIFSTKSVAMLPCYDLKIINDSWQKNSQGKFGFSKQKEIYLKTGNQIREYNSDNYLQFLEQVGWDKDQLNFSPHAPDGHLPAPLIEGYDDAWYHDLGLLYNRLDHCGF